MLAEPIADIGLGVELRKLDDLDARRDGREARRQLSGMVAPLIVIVRQDHDITPGYPFLASLGPIARAAERKGRQAVRRQRVDVLFAFGHKDRIAGQRRVKWINRGI